MTEAKEARPVAQHIDLSASMQRHIFATVVRIPGAMPRCRSVLNPDYFSDQSVSDGVAWLLGHWDEFKTTPSKAALLDAFKNEPETRALIKDAFVEEIPDPEYTIKRIVDFARNRALRAACVMAAGAVAAQAKGEVMRDEKGRPMYTDPDAYIRDLVDKAINVGRSADDLGEDILADLEPGIENLLHPVEDQLFTSGFEHLDHAGCMIGRGEIGCVLAPAKKGKSHLLLNIAVGNLKQGFNVVYYNMEIKEDRLRQRVYRRLAGNTVDQKADISAFVKKLREKAPKLLRGKLLVKKYPARLATVDDLRAHMSRIVAEGFKPDMVIVDYLGIAKPRHEKDEMRFNLESNWLDFRSLCQEFKVAGWSAAQTNRGGVESNLVTMSSIGECFAIVQHIDVGFSINISQSEYDSGTGRFFVFASRNEQDGSVVPFTHDFSRSAIRTSGITTATAGAQTAPRANPEARSNQRG